MVHSKPQCFKNYRTHAPLIAFLVEIFEPNIVVAKALSFKETKIWEPKLEHFQVCRCLGGGKIKPIILFFILGDEKFETTVFSILTNFFFPYVSDDHLSFSLRSEPGRQRWCHGLPQGISNLPHEWTGFGNVPWP